MTAVLLAASAGLTAVGIPITVYLAGSRDGDGYLWSSRLRARAETFARPFIGLVLPGSTTLSTALVVHGFMGSHAQAWAAGATGVLGLALLIGAGFGVSAGVEWWRDRHGPDDGDSLSLPAFSLIKAPRVLRGRR